MKKRLLSCFVSATFLMSSAMPVNFFNAAAADCTIDVNAKLSEPKTTDDSEIRGNEFEDVLAEVVEIPVENAEKQAEMITLPPIHIYAEGEAAPDTSEKVQLGENLTAVLYKTGEVQISGYGDMFDTFEENPFSDPSRIKQIIFCDTHSADKKYITSIADNVFMGCENLEYVLFSNHIKRIGSNAFRDCPAMVTFSPTGADVYQKGEFVFPSALEEIGNSAFENCKGMKTLTVPGTVRFIGDRAFYGCIRITDATINSGTEHIGDYVFGSCVSLESLTLPFAGHDVDLMPDSKPIATSFFDDYWHEGEYSLDGDLYGVPMTLTTITITGGDIIPDCTFMGMRSLVNVNIPDSIKMIGAYAFADCDAIEGIAITGKTAVRGEFAIPSSLTVISDCAYLNCKGLKKITVPGKVNDIGNRAFSGCSHLTDAEIKDGVKYIGDRIFEGCVSLESLTLPYAGHQIDLMPDSKPVATTFFDEYWHEGEYSLDGDLYGIPASLTTITITGGEIIPDCAFMGMRSLKNVNIPDTIKMVGAYAFADCTALAKLPVGTKTTVIGDKAFSNCESAIYANFQLPAAVTEIGNSAFENCKGMKTLNVPGTVRFIGDRAFYGCTRITDATINSGTEHIGDYVFGSCVSLESLTLPFAGHDVDLMPDSKPIATSFFDDYWHEGEYSLDGDLYGVPASLTTITITGGEIIPDCTFTGMRSLVNVNIPDSIKMIGAYAFADCDAIEGIAITGKTAVRGEFAIPSSLTVISDCAYMNCKGLKKITVPGKVNDIGNRAFSGCSHLTDAEIKDGVKYIGDRIFEGCVSLESLTLPYAGHQIDLMPDSKPVATTFFDEYWHEGEYSLDGDLYGIPASLTTITITGGEIIPDCAFMGMRSLKNVNIPDTIKMVGAYAFADCTALTKLPIGAKTTVIGDKAFSNCESAIYANFQLPAAVTEISNSAFENCKGMKTLTVPGTVRFIGDRAFYGCTRLTDATINSGTEHIGDYVFGSCVSLESLTLPFAGHDIDLMPDSKPIATSFFDDYWHEGEYSLDGDLYGVPASLTTITITGGDIIPDCTFMGMRSLVNVNIPDSIKMIGAYAFADCDAIEGIAITGKTAVRGEFAIPSSLTVISDCAYLNCKGLKKITVPGKVNDIGNRAFSGCSHLTDAEIKDGVKYIGDRIFEGCVSLESLTLPYAGHQIDLMPDSKPVATTFFDEYWHEGEYSLDGDLYGIPASLTTITITGGEIIPDCAFMGMRSLTTVTLPELSYICDSAFADCTELKNVNVTTDEATWKKVTIGDNNEPLKAAKMTYNVAASAAVKGDANCDGKVTIADAAAVLQYLGNKDRYSLSETGRNNADCDGDRGITTSDALLIQKVAAGVVSGFGK